MNKNRKIKPKVRMYVEGKTEYNYFSELGKRLDLDFTIETIDMRGGGYSNFLLQIKKKGYQGCTVIFVIVDLDNVSSDRKNFKELIDYCNSQNKRCPVSYFLIGSFKDFEYFACLHSKEYNNGNTDQFIINNFKYKNINDFKADNNIFNFLNSNGRDREIALSKLSKRESFVNNDFNPIIRKKGDVKIKNKRITLNPDFETIKNSNMCDFSAIFEKSVE